MRKKKYSIICAEFHMKCTTSNQVTRTWYTNSKRSDSKNNVNNKNIEVTRANTFPHKLHYCGTLLAEPIGPLDLGSHQDLNLCPDTLSIFIIPFCSKKIQQCLIFINKGVIRCVIKLGKKSFGMSNVGH